MEEYTSPYGTKVLLSRHKTARNTEIKILDTIYQTADAEDGSLNTLTCAEIGKICGRTKATVNECIHSFCHRIYDSHPGLFKLYYSPSGFQRVIVFADHPNAQQRCEILSQTMESQDQKYSDPYEWQKREDMEAAALSISDDEGDW